MTSDDIRVPIDNNLDSIDPTPAINGSSEEMMTSITTGGSGVISMDGGAFSQSLPLSSCGVASYGLVSAPTIEQPSNEEYCCRSIHRVPHRLREVKPIAYEPNVISIGPYHCGKEHLKDMDGMKRSCFDKMVKEKKLERSEFFKAMETLEEEARKCYDQCNELLQLFEQDFIEMMVYDGCFIVQLIRNGFPQDLCKLGRHIQADMWYDLLLLENQLPFFVLLKLDRMITPHSEGDHDEFARSVLSKFFRLDTYGPQIGSGYGTYDPSSTKDVNHLLDLVHRYFRPSSEGIMRHQNYLNIKSKEAKGSQRSWKFISSATELDDAGINFLGKKVLQDQDDQGLFDITFTKDTDVLCCNILNKVLITIPTLPVDDHTDRMLRNLLAYEQFTQIKEPTYVSDYMVFMDNLINTDKDVQLLRTSGVIDNWLGDDEAVAQMFNKLRDSIYASEDFYYAEIFDEVDKHCKRKWNKYKAILRKDYFNSPWSLISFVAAFVLLVLTLVQTAYTCISYYHPS